MQRVSINVYAQLKTLPEIREARPEFKNIHVHVLQNVIQKLDRAFQAFFKRCKAGQTPGFPRFRNSSRWDSITFKQVWDTPNNRWFGPGKPLPSSKIYLPKIGNVKIKLHRPLEGKPKTLTVKREGPHWYAVYTCEVESKPLEPTGETVGIDLGTNPNFLITSDGEFVEAPRHYQKAQKKLRTAQRTVARRKRRSKRQGKARQAVARLHRKVARQRLDFHHKTAHWLVGRFDHISHENLNVIGLARMRAAKGVQDAGWAQFLNILSQKAECAARTLIAVDPKFSSQDCSSCGHRQKVPIGKPYKCVACGLLEHRDVNAAKNVKARGARSAPSARGPHEQPSTT
jgi:putative transposase